MFKQTLAAFPPSIFPHKCTCGKRLKEKEAKHIGNSKELYWFNCPKCKTTFTKEKNEKRD